MPPDDRTSPDLMFTPSDTAAIGQNVGQQQDVGSEKSVTGRISADEYTLASLLEALEGEKFDVEQFLKDAIHLQQKYNVRTRELGVVFQDLRVQGLSTTRSYQPTVGSALNPLLFVGKIQSMLHLPVRDIISGFEGVVNPGEMLLVLGRPGAGCSTFLKALSNQHDDYYGISGLLRFSSFTSKQVHDRFRGDVIYCLEQDVHFPTLTVEQTLSFAARAHMPSKSARADGVDRSQYTNITVNALTTIFGLRHAKRTRVGNATVRGISGGERKRVSIAETLATRARLGAWDNSTRGLDSSTALEFVRGLRIATDILGFTSIMSAYQASELLYELFDKVCLIYEGRMVYYGLSGAARQYFVDQGWEPANRQTTPDFLTTVTDPCARVAREGYENCVPRTADEMAAAFQRHSLAEENKRQVASFLAANIITDYGPGGEDPLVKLPNVSSVPREQKELKRRSYIESAQAERSKHTRRESPYTISLFSQIREVMVRRFQKVQGEWSAHVITISAFAFQATIMGTLFLRVADATGAYFSRGGVLFFSIVFDSLSSMGEISSLYAQRPIVRRQAKAAMYHPFTEAIALTIVDIPITLIRLFIFCVIIYFLVGLQQTAGQFFLFYLIVVLISLVMKAFYRALAASTKRQSTAQATGGGLTLILALYTGYAIPKPSMIGALKWIVYINPLSYAFEAILTNEFHTLNGRCSQIVPVGPGYEDVSLANQVCTTIGSIPGQATVDGNRFLELSFGYLHSHLWRNVGILLAFLAGFITILSIFTELNTASAFETSTALYKRGAHNARNAELKGADEEKGHVQGNAVESRVDSSQQAEKAMEATPKIPDVFSWQNLRYSVPVGKGKLRLLLDDVSGYVVPGKLTALIGESGAGKTTLLNVLAGRTNIGVVTGDRFVNGQALPHDFQAQTGYCQQMDTHLHESTVREALLFSAKLRQPADVPLADKEAYVEMCLKMCGLDTYADAIVGTLNVEHKKRTTIGVELAAKPKLLLFLDEPTSGLDSQSAWAIMTFLRSLADRGQAILCTIHQPSSELFQIFDRLLLLQKGGQTVYFGDLGQNCSTLINYFEKNGARKCEPRENPAEWMLDVIGAGAAATTTIDWHDAWNRSEEAAKFNIHLEEIHEEGRKRPPVQARSHREFATSWWTQLYELTVRANIAYWRNPTYIVAKLSLNIVAGIFIGFTFFQEDSTIQGTQNKIFGIFILTMISAAHAFQLQVLFLNFLSIYQTRERPSRIYSWTALVTSLILVEIPWNVLGSTLLFLCWYWTVGFDTSRAGYTFITLATWFPLYYTTMSHAVAAMSPNPVIDSVLFSALFSFIIVFAGVLQPYSQLGWWQWMYRISPFTYFMEGVLGQALGRLEISCSMAEFAIVEPPSGLTCTQYLGNFIAFAGGYLQNPDALTGCQFCAYRTTDQFLETTFNIFYKNHWRNFGILMVFVAFNFVLVFTLTYIFRIRLRL